jgi:hypothetical protein
MKKKQDIRIPIEDWWDQLYSKALNDYIKDNFFKYYKEENWYNEIWDLSYSILDPLVGKSIFEVIIVLYFALSHIFNDEMEMEYRLVFVPKKKNKGV